MSKVGRNEPCPCRSGKKYKKCCGLNPKEAVIQLTPEQAMKVTLNSGVEAIQAQAENRNATKKELGVFFFYSTAAGDAWLLEMTQLDCVKVAEKGENLPPALDENPETIEIKWTHTFVIRNKQMEITAYEDKAVAVLSDAPTKEISAAVRRIRKKFSPEELEKLHLDPDEVDQE